jgi:DNA adenine methylase
LGLMHVKGVTKARMRILESYIAPVDFTINGMHVKKGTWLMAARVVDPKLWQACKDGRFTGWSIEGDAQFEMIEN